MRLKLIIFIMLSFSIFSQDIFKEKKFTTKILPVAVAVDNNENVYIVDRANYCIQKFDNTGKYVVSFGVKNPDVKFKEKEGAIYSLPADIYIHDNLIYLLDMNNGIYVFTLDGQIKGYFSFDNGKLLGELEKPQAIFVDENNIYVADTNNHRIQIFTKEGKIVDDFGYRGVYPGSFFNPSGISKIRDKLLVSDTDNKRVEIYYEDGVYYKTLIPKDSTKELSLYSPADIFIDSSGFIYIVDKGKNKIFVYNKKFEPVLYFGKSGSGDSQFSGIKDVWVSSEFIYVADYNNQCIKVFDKELNFIKVIGKSKAINMIVTGLFAVIFSVIILVLLFNSMKKKRNKQEKKNDKK